VRLSSPGEATVERIARLAHDAANRLFESESIVGRISAAPSVEHAAALANEASRAITAAVAALREIGAEARAGAGAADDLAAILRDAAPGLADGVDAASIRIRGGTREIAALREAIAGLVSAERAGAAPHAITLAVERSEGAVGIRLSSTAPPRSEAARAELLDPVRLRSPDALGGGLSHGAAAALAARLGGSLRIDDDGSGRRLELVLPTERRSASSRPDGPGEILVVDDEPGVARAATLLLEALGHRAGVAATVAEAKQRIEQGGVAGLIVDRGLGTGGDSGDLLAWIRERRPELRGATVVSSGDPGLRGAHAGFPVLAKPFGLAELAALFGSRSGRG
jgi:CheY-like chemotaxis protein